MGQWTNQKNQAGPLSLGAVIYGEIAELSRLAQQHAAKFNHTADIITSFGPHLGLFFADAFRLNRYRWSNLPTDLRDEIQKHVSLHGHGNRKLGGTIRSVMWLLMPWMGWIMQLRRGERFIRSQGDRRLPEELQSALAEGDRKEVDNKRCPQNTTKRKALADFYGPESIPESQSSN